MPTYEYRCKSCGHRFEQMQKISSDPLLECPECKKPQLQRLVNATAFHLKGSGWYKTDYASGSKSGAEGGGAKSSSATSKNSDGDSASSGSTNSSSSKESSSSTAGSSESRSSEAKANSSSSATSSKGD